MVYDRGYTMFTGFTGITSKGKNEISLDPNNLFIE
jgi:hypothetical protein